MPGCLCGVYGCNLPDLLPFVAEWGETRQPDVVIGQVILTGPLLRGPVDPLGRDPASTVRGGAATVGRVVYWPADALVGPDLFRRRHPRTEVRAVPDLAADTLRAAGEAVP
ncbi:hypothetical protein [Blastococcus mobilis]|uniref:hypothetical protein n=1 Tax=Blastococcus mobilis TaxID=1938746 RepID=UPI0011312BFF|nr:hypothetical protein [Blastococcus mobilis]